MSFPLPAASAPDAVAAPLLGRELVEMKRAGILKPTLFPIIGNYMSPTLTHGDFVFAVPCDRYVCPGLYVIEQLGKALVCRADGRPMGGIWWRFDAFEPHESTAEQFNGMVLGYVCASLDVIDGDAFTSGRLPQPARWHA